MAVNPNFTFADPALQAQVVNMAQVQAAADAARAQQMTQTLAELSRQRQAASDREERRAIREGDIRRLEATEAERRRQFDVGTGLTREDIASREKIAGVRNKEADEKEAYNNLLNLIERGEDIPTAAELEARMVDISEPRKKELRNRREMRFRSMLQDFTLVDDEVAGLNAALQAGAKDRNGQPYTPEGLLNTSRFRNNIRLNRQTNLFESLVRRPREDARIPSASEGVFPQPSPGFVPRPTDFRVPIAEPINAVQDRLAASGRGGFWSRMLEGVQNPFTGIGSVAPMAGARRLFAPSPDGRSFIGMVPDRSMFPEPTMLDPMDAQIELAPVAGGIALPFVPR
jgi:hypothetical protein